MLVLGCQSYQPNSIVDAADIGEEDSALLCYTDIGGVKMNRLGKWYFPNGSAVRANNSNHDSYRNRGTNVVGLNRRDNTIIPTGIFRCEIPDTSGINQTVYIGIYPQGQGM